MMNNGYTRKLIGRMPTKEIVSVRIKKAPYITTTAVMCYRYGHRFQLMDYHSGLQHETISINGIITSNIDTVERMPGLAAPLLGKNLHIFDTQIQYAQ